MKNREKTVKLLESFLSNKQVDGVCGYMVDPDGEGLIQVIVVLDIDYIKDANTKPGFVARMIREGVKQEIKKWIGLDVYVGSTAKKCDELESMTESKKKYIVTESQMKFLLENEKALFWIKRRYDLVLGELKETFDLMEFDICRIDNYDKFENKFFSVLMDGLHPYFYDDPNIDNIAYDAMLNILKDLFYVECTEFYADGREKC